MRDRGLLHVPLSQEPSLTMADRYIDYVRLDEVQVAPRNPKVHDDAGITRSLDHFGMVEVPQLDDRTGQLVAGHGRYKQLVRLAADGRRVPDGVRVAEDGTWMMPVVRGWASRTDEDAETYLVTSNRLTENGGWDDRGLLEVLADLGEAQLLELSGFDATDVDNLEALLDVDAWDPAPLSRSSSSRSSSTAAGDGDELDELDEEDDDVADHEMWPKIDVRVQPHVFDAWRTLLDEHDGKDDATKVEQMLRAAGHLP